MDEQRTQDENETELGFLNAMQAYRKAKDSGDEKAMQEAEDAWRERVRAELVSKMSQQ